MSYTCKYCDRKFTRKIYFERHEDACGLMNKSRQERRFELEEKVDTPTQRKQYELLLELARIVKKQEKQIESLTRIIERTQKKKLSVTTWLDENACARQSFEEWYATIVINQTHLDSVYKDGLTKGILEAFESKVTAGDTLNTIPIRSFTQKKNELYTYDGEKWNDMSHDQLKQFVIDISKKMRALFTKWVDEHQGQINNARSEFSSSYLNKTYKINGGKLTSSQLQSCIKRGLYEQLKTDLQNVVEYEV